MNPSPALETPEGTAELNKGLDVIIETMKGDSLGLVTPVEQVKLTLVFFSDNEIASLLVLAARRLADQS